MAIKLSDYQSIPKSANVKIHKTDIRKFHFRFKMKVWSEAKEKYTHKQYSKIFNIKATNHSRKENIEEAKTEFIIFKSEIENKKNNMGIEKISLDSLFCKYMENEPLTDWTHKKKHIYDLYIGESGLSNITKDPTEELLAKRAKYDEVKIGGMEISSILPYNIEKIISQMAKVHNLSPRTQKSISWIFNEGKTKKIETYLKEDDKLGKVLDLLHVHYLHSENISYFLKTMNIINQRLNEMDVDYLVRYYKHTNDKSKKEKKE